MLPSCPFVDNNDAPQSCHQTHTDFNQAPIVSSNVQGANVNATNMNHHTPTMRRFQQPNSSVSNSITSNNPSTNTNSPSKYRGHVMHSLRLVMKARAGSACVPAGQGCGAEEPSTQSDPRGQSRHAVLRSEDVYLPPGHRVHTGILAFSPEEPGRQLAGADDPEGQLVPAGQVMHWLRLIMKSSDELL